MTARVHKFNDPVDLSKEQPGQYYANVYKDGEFVAGYHFEMHSGRMAQEEVVYMRQHLYLPSQGYTIEW